MGGEVYSTNAQPLSCVWKSELDVMKQNVAACVIIAQTVMRQHLGCLLGTISPLCLEGAS